MTFDTCTELQTGSQNFTRQRCGNGEGLKLLQAYRYCCELLKEITKKDPDEGTKKKNTRLVAGKVKINDIKM